MSQKSLLKSRYKPDLNEFIDQCESNYDLIVKLLPWLAKLGKNGLTCVQKKATQFRPTSGHKIDLQLIDKAKYTITIMLRVHSPSQSTDADINLMVRLYQDAQLLEVVDKIGPKALKPINKGSDLIAKQADEKRQLNRFLGESLKYCLDTVLP